MDPALNRRIMKLSGGSIAVDSKELSCQVETWCSYHYVSNNSLDSLQLITPSIGVDSIRLVPSPSRDLGSLLGDHLDHNDRR